MLAKQARSTFGDRVARAFLLKNDGEFEVALQFNALLATEVRLEAKRQGERSIFEGKK